MKAFWLFVGLFLALATNPAPAQLGQSAANITPFCVHSPCAPRRLTYEQLRNDSGTLATRQPIMGNGLAPPNYGTQHDNGIYPYGINGFSWELGGDEYLGDPMRVNNYACGTVKPFACTGMTAWHIVYPEAATIHGSAKSSVPGTNVFYRNYQSWCHAIAGGWTKVQDPITSHGLTTGLLSAKQDAGFGNQPTTDLGGGNYSMPTPAPGFANHGWIQDRGGYTVSTVDHCYAQYEVRVDQPNANLLAALGIDWWQFPVGGSAPANNTGYSQSIWVRITPDWTRITNTAMGEAAFRADPPPPFVGVP